MKITSHKIKIPHSPRPVKIVDETPPITKKAQNIPQEAIKSTYSTESNTKELKHQNDQQQVTKPDIQSTTSLETLPNGVHSSTESQAALPEKTVDTIPQTDAQNQNRSNEESTISPKNQTNDKEATKQNESNQVNKTPSVQQSRSDKKILVNAKNICKSFYAGQEETKVLKNLSVQIYDEDFLIIVGPSGSGKSTLLHILLGLEIPTSGELIFLEKDLYKDTTEDIRSEFRKQHIGMVYQQPNWIKSMSVLENIAFPLILRGYRQELAHEIAYGALQEVHMEMHANQPATELSGGQQQRVSLARCIVHNPEIIVADEPTGNLDYESGQEVMQLLQGLNVKDKKTVIMVTHDIEYIKFANCAVQIFDGQVAGYYGRDNLSDLTTKLHTKHLDQSIFKQTNDQKTN